MQLLKFTGPECPRCGCPDTQPVESHPQSFQTFESRRCEHCGHSFYCEIARPADDQLPLSIELLP